MADMSTAKTKPRHALVEVEKKTYVALKKIRAELGNPKQVTLNTAALSHVVRQVVAGNLRMENGVFKPTGAPASTAAA